MSNESWRGHWPCDWVKPAIHSFSNGGPLSLLLDCHCRLTSATLNGYVIWCIELVVWEAVGWIKLMYVIGNQIVNIYTEWDEYWRDLCWLIWMNEWMNEWMIIYIYILCVNIHGSRGFDWRNIYRCISHSNIWYPPIETCQMLSTIKLIN